MCIIAAKPAGIDMPTENILENMWARNKDGAGIMYAVNNRVHIEKGFMKYEDFLAKIKTLERKYNLSEISVVMHFRITTHGGTKPENCHPFPITDSIGMLKKLEQTTKLGVAHNGIIPCTPRNGVSDTMEYIASQLAPLSKAVPKFYKNKHLMQMIDAATDSKLAFMNSEGKIYTIGDFTESGGIMYSNKSFQRTNSWRDYYYGTIDNNTWEMYEQMRGYAYKNVMWLDEAKGEFITDEKGDMYCGDYAIDRNGNVYEYDYVDDALERIEAKAYNAEGMRLTYNESSPMCTQEIVITGYTGGLI